MKRAMVAGCVVVCALAGVLAMYTSTSPDSPPFVGTGGLNRSVPVPAHVGVPSPDPSAHAESSQFGRPRAVRNSLAIARRPSFLQS